MDSNSNNFLRNHCYVNNEETNFVGVKLIGGDIGIYFPKGYQLPIRDEDLRVDINNLIYLLEKFKREDSRIEKSDFDSNILIDFPIHAYLKVIRDFLRTGRYYTETEIQYKTNVKGNISWSRTISNQKALVQKNHSLIFTNMTVRSNTPNVEEKITQIHRYCVYEAFEKLGWIYVSYMPEKPHFYLSQKESLTILECKLASTYNDREKDLFMAMISILKYLNIESPEKSIFFGTNSFERIWERMIDKAFGIKDKEQYFPHTRWILDYDSPKENAALQPDSIMIYDNKIYILDAKYYRYGFTGNPSHLPNSSDICKQITYGEYIDCNKKSLYSNVYNAFLMPFNCRDNIFFRNKAKEIQEEKNIFNIGEAIGDWKPDLESYERIQGIVIDTRFLIYNYSTMSTQQKHRLAEAIEEVKFRNPLSK